MKANEELTALRTGKDNATVVLSSADYNAKIHEPLEQEAYLNYWISRLCPSSGTPNTRKHNFSEDWSVFETFLFPILHPGWFSA
jgi:hypothetical protein